MFKPHGFVYIIGVGPGDPELLTLKAIDRISKAEVIVYGKLVPDEIVYKYAKNAKEIIKIEKKHRKDAIKVVIEKALEGKIVAHLKNGDPTIFSNLRDEIEELEKYGISYEVIPGVSSITAGAISGNFSLTDFNKGIRGFSVINGHGEEVSVIEKLVNELGLVIMLMPNFEKIKQLVTKFNIIIVSNASKNNEIIINPGSENEIIKLPDPCIVYIFRKDYNIQLSKLSKSLGYRELDTPQ